MLSDFWQYFETVAGPRLARRESTFRQTFSYLDKLADPLIIIETGSVRTLDNWEGDGQSTLLFDRYVQQRQAGQVHTIDINPQCQPWVSHLVSVYKEDSVSCLHRLAQRAWPKQSSFLFYLDSFDVDFQNPYPSAAHHLKELVAIAPMLSSDTLVVVDDSPAQHQGKGFLVAEYAKAIGARLLFHDYQLGIIHLK